MKATVSTIAALLTLGLGASLARADGHFSCAPGYPASCGWGYNGFPGSFGPTLFQAPSLPPRPYNGLLPWLPKYPGMAGAGPGAPIFCTHPYARSPRDFFMYGQTSNDY